MPSAQRSITVDRPVEEVFAFFTDPANDPRWRSAVKEISADGPISVGQRIHQVLRGPGGLSMPADVEVTGYEPGARYAFRGVAGPVRPLGEYLFTAAGERTTVSFSLSVELTGPKRALMGRSVQRTMESEVAMLDRAKVVLEQS